MKGFKSTLSEALIRNDIDDFSFRGKEYCFLDLIYDKDCFLDQEVTELDDGRIWKEGDFVINLDD